MQILRKRKKSEENIKKPIDDDYGLDCINAMISDVQTQYEPLVMGEDDVEDASDSSDEDGDASSDARPQPSRRYVSVVLSDQTVPVPVSYQYRYWYIVDTMSSLILTLIYLFTSFLHRQVSSHSRNLITPENPHGFQLKVLVRLQAIENPEEYDKAVKRLLSSREVADRLLSRDEYREKVHRSQNQRRRQRKIDAG
jgi:hypothetical protein